MALRVPRLCWLAVVLAAALLLDDVAAVASFPVYRMLQYQDGDAMVGAQRANVNLLATASVSGSALLHRQVVLVRAQALTPALWDRLVRERRAEGVLVLLPAAHDMHGLLGPGSQWRATEAHLVAQTGLRISVFFAHETPTLTRLYHELGGPELVQGDTQGWGPARGSSQAYRLVVNGPTEASAVASPKVVNVQAWMPGNPALASTSSRDVPTVAVFANYDTLSVVPALANGTDSNGSGVVALLELARLWSLAYGDSRTHGEPNMLFVLTGAGRLDYSGTEKWLASCDMRLKRSIDFALCLDTLGHGDSLHLHVSKPPKRAYVARLYDRFRAVAQRHGIDFSVHVKKVNVAKPEIPWEHERFSRHRVWAGTLSACAKAREAAERAHVADTIRTVNVTTLLRNVRFAAEALALHVYGNATGDSPLSVFDGALGLSDAHVNAWLQTVSSTPRMTPYIEEDAPFLVWVETALSSFAQATDRVAHALEHRKVFHEAGVSEMHAYRVKSVVFDFVFAALIAAYLGALYVALKVHGEGAQYARELPYIGPALGSVLGKLKSQ